MSKNYTLDKILLHILQNFTINQIVIWIGIIIFLAYTSTYMNITLLQFMLISIVVFFILYMSQLKDMEIEKLQENNKLTETNNYSLLNFVDSVAYFKKYNPPVYSQFLYKVKQYINLLKFANIHEQNKYRLYPKKTIKENLESQKEDIIETFSSFEHTLDDRITSAYKLRDLTDQLKRILTKSNLII
jgi:hypothetical protein